MFRYLLMSLAWCAGWSSTCAQEQDQNEEEIDEIVYTSSWMGSIYLDVAIPNDLFAQNISRTGIGMGGEILYNVQYQMPVWVGIGVHSFAFDKFDIRYTEQFDGEIFEYKETTASRVFVAAAIVRFQPEVNFFLRPYLQGGFGRHWFFTNTKVKDIDANEVISRNNDNQDSEFGFSLHIGSQIIFPGVSDVRGDLRVGYFRNPSVEYMRYDAELGGPDGFPIDYFERKISTVDFIGLNVGIVVGF